MEPSGKGYKIVTIVLAIGIGIGVIYLEDTYKKHTERMRNKAIDIAEIVDSEIELGEKMATEYIETINQDTESLAKTIAIYIEDIQTKFTSTNIEDVEEVNKIGIDLSTNVTNIARQANIAELNIIDKNGKIIYSNITDNLGHEYEKDSNTMRVIGEEGKAEHEEIRESTIDGKKYKYSVVGTNFGAIQVGIQADEILGTLKNLEISTILNELTNINEIDSITILGDGEVGRGQIRTTSNMDKETIDNIRENREMSAADSNKSIQYYLVDKNDDGNEGDIKKNDYIIGIDNTDVDSMVKNILEAIIVIPTIVIIALALYKPNKKGDGHSGKTE